MVARGQPILQADMDALAVLANGKLAPAVPYAFTHFAGKDKIGLPTDIVPAADYSAGDFPDGQKVTLNLYGYKTIDGIKTYTFTPLLKAFIPTAGAGQFSMTWTWAAVAGPTSPDGYIAMVPISLGDGWEYFWKDIGNVETLTDDGNFTGWNIDRTLDSDNAGFPAENLPCDRGAWLKTLNQIRADLFTGMDLFGGSSRVFSDAFLLSGPWCVSAGRKCYLNLNSTPIYKDLRFLYSEADSVDGNQLAPEIDILGQYIGVDNGANAFNFGVAGTLNGRIIIFSDPQGQSAADWNVAASHAGITISFDANYTDGDRIAPPFTFTAFIFDFVNVAYVPGTPIVLTVTPLAGGSVYNAGNPVGAGGKLAIVFTGPAAVYATEDAMAIHYAGKAAKSAVLTDTLAPLTFTAPLSAAEDHEAHFRSTVDGVYIAKTLPTFGVMPYLDQDLPQYSPDSFSAEVASSRREPLSPTLPYMPSVDNRGALWPVLRDTDFAPDLVGLYPLTGSTAWKRIIATPYASSNTNSLSPPAGVFNFDSVDVPLDAVDARFITMNPDCVLYVRANDFPTLVDFDATAPAGTWISLAASIPGFATDTTWFVGVYNPTTGTLQSATTSVVLTRSLDGPNGTFFPTREDDSGAIVPLMEGTSYRFSDPGTFDARPVPLLGYQVYSITFRRRPVDTGSGILVAPSADTEDLPVKIGLMTGFGFDSAGVFEEISTTVIPAGSASITVDVSLPVLSGTPLAYQCDELVHVRALVNFQPIVQSRYDVRTAKVNGADYSIGRYESAPWYDQRRALLAFKEDVITRPIILPICAEIYNDLNAVLQLLP